MEEPVALVGVMGFLFCVKDVGRVESCRGLFVGFFVGVVRYELVYLGRNVVRDTFCAVGYEAVFGEVFGEVCVFDILDGVAIVVVGAVAVEV